MFCVPITNAVIQLLTSFVVPNIYDSLLSTMMFVFPAIMLLLLLLTSFKLSRLPEYVSLSILRILHLFSFIAFKIKSKSDQDYERLFTFKQKVFALNQFSITRSDDDENEEI